MEHSASTNVLDNLRLQLNQSRNEYKKGKPMTSLSQTRHLRNKTESINKIEIIPKDISYRLDTPTLVQSNLSQNEVKLKEILGAPSKCKKLPITLEEIEKEAKIDLSPINDSAFMPNLENLKGILSSNHEKNLKKVAEEGGFLYRTHSGLILPQLSTMYEKVAKRKNSSSLNRISRNELDLGNPSGRKQVEVIIAWLESMMHSFVTSQNLENEEKIRRASLINTICLKEVIRQVSSHCIERGVLLQKIWNAQVDIYDKQDNQREVYIKQLCENYLCRIKQKDEKISELEKKFESSSKELKSQLDAKENAIIGLKKKIEDLKLQFFHDRQKIISGITNQVTAESNIPNQTNSKVNKTYLKAQVPVVMLGYFDKFRFFHKTKVIQELNWDKVNEENLDQIVQFVDTSSQSTSTNDLSLHIGIFEKSSQTNKALETNSEFIFSFIPETFEIPLNSQTFRSRRKNIRSSTYKLDSLDKRTFKNTSKFDSKRKSQSLYTSEKWIKASKSVNTSRGSERSFDKNHSHKKQGIFKKLVEDKIKDLSKTHKQSEESKNHFEAPNTNLNVPQITSDLNLSRTRVKYTVRLNEIETEDNVDNSFDSENSSFKSNESFDQSFKFERKKNLKNSPKCELITVENDFSYLSRSSSRSKNRKKIKESTQDQIVIQKIKSNFSSRINSPAAKNEKFNEAELMDALMMKLNRLANGQDSNLSQLRNFKSFHDFELFLKSHITSNPTPLMSDQVPPMQDPNPPEFSITPNPILAQLKISKPKKSGKKVPYKSKSPSKPAEPQSTFEQKPFKTERPRRGGVLQTEEFALGQISRRLPATHPGPKLLSSILSSIRPTGPIKLTLKSLMKIINSVYQEKIYLMKENLFKHETSAILYDLLTKKYGLKNVAERHFYHVVRSTLAFQDAHKRVKIFSEFLKADQEKFKIENWNFWVYALDLVDSVGFGKVLVDDGASEVFCALGSALNAFVSIFTGKVPEKVIDEVSATVSRMKVVSQVGFKRSSTVKIVENVNLDEFLMICLEVYLKCKEKIKERLWPHLDMDEGLMRQSLRT